MRIDEFHGAIINTKDVCIHDTVLKFMQFTRMNKELNLVFSRLNEANYQYTIDFYNVIGFEMTACDFWGASPCVLDFEYVDWAERTIIPKVKHEWSNYPQLLSDISYENYIEIRITFSSGDHLSIACEYLILND